MRLDAILIPGSKNENTTRKRARKAVEIIINTTDNHLKIIASGGKSSKEFNYPSEAHVILDEIKRYEELTGEIDLDDIKMENKAENTIQNVVYSLENLTIRNLGIVSNPLQIKRIEKIITRAKELGLVNGDMQIEGIETDSMTKKEEIYEFFAEIITNYNLKRKDITEIGNIEKIFKKIGNYLV
jgi:hypothetical protein